MQQRKKLIAILNKDSKIFILTPLFEFCRVIIEKINFLISVNENFELKYILTQA